jgi:hypothetical protein
MSGELPVHNHGREYQVRVIHEDGTGAQSEWTDAGNVAWIMESLRKPQAKAYWLRERSIAVAACHNCGDKEATVVEYPLTDCLSFRRHPRDSDYLMLTGLKSPSPESGEYRGSGQHDAQRRCAFLRTFVEIAESREIGACHATTFA